MDAISLIIIYKYGIYERMKCTQLYFCHLNNQKRQKWTHFSDHKHSITLLNVLHFFFSVLTGCEMRNKYDVLNSVSQQCYYAEEGKFSFSKLSDFNDNSCLNFLKTARMLTSKRSSWVHVIPERNGGLPFQGGGLINTNF